MPTRDLFDQFRDNLNQLGNEADILEKRGESIEDIDFPSVSIESPQLDDIGDSSEELSLDSFLNQVGLDLDEPKKKEDIPTDDLALDIPSLDSLESIDFDDPSNLDSDLSELDDSFSLTEDLEKSDDIDLSEDFLNDDSLEELDTLDDILDEGEMQFSLGDFGEEFNFQEGINLDDIDNSLDSLDSLEESFFMDEDSNDEDEDYFELSEESVDEIQKSLLYLPLNLKIAIQDALAEGDLTGERYKKLIELLIKGESTKAIAQEFYNVSGKKIPLPKGASKFAGREFLEKQKGFFFQFLEKGLPIIRLTGLIALFSALFLYLLFTFIYRPLQAKVYYEDGLAKIKINQFEKGFSYFDKAYWGWFLGPLDVKGWPLKNAFLEYAKAYEEQREYNYAQKMYDALLGEFPQFKKGILGYGKFLTYTKGEYEKASMLYSLGLDYNFRDLDILLAQGDNFMLWGKEVPEYYEQARYSYATALSYYDAKDEIALRMLRYFLVQKDQKNIETLANIYENKNHIKGDPQFIAESLALLGAYFIDQNRVSDAKVFLFKAIDLYETSPKVHYEISRYFRKTYNFPQEKMALKKTLFFLDNENQGIQKDIMLRVNTLKRLGELDLINGDLLEAESKMVRAVQIVEEAQKRGLLSRSLMIGSLYKELATIKFKNTKDYKSALPLFQKTLDNGYKDSSILYSIGFIYYNREEYDKAADYFNRSLDLDAHPRDIYFALANSLVKRRNYVGAENFYKILLQNLTNEMNNLPFLLPQEIDEHFSLVSYYQRVYNNLAYVKFSLYKRDGIVADRTDALIYLSKAAEFEDQLSRDRDSMVRESPQNSLAFNNTMNLLKTDSLKSLKFEREILSSLKDLWN